MKTTFKVIPTNNGFVEVLDTTTETETHHRVVISSGGYGKKRFTKDTKKSKTDKAVFVVVHFLNCKKV